MKLFKEILKNSSLKFIDAKTKEILKFKDLLFDINSIEENNKQLVFLYCKNQLSSTGMYFSLLKGNFTIALLNEELSIDFKTEIEKIYQPNIIIDKTRAEVKFYSINLVKSNFQKIQLLQKANQL
mgnify:CR=1 FL=1